MQLQGVKGLKLNLHVFGEYDHYRMQHWETHEEVADRFIDVDDGDEEEEHVPSETLTVAKYMQHGEVLTVAKFLQHCESQMEERRQ